MNRSSYGWKAEVFEPEIVRQEASKPEVSITILLCLHVRILRDKVRIIGQRLLHRLCNNVRWEFDGKVFRV